MKNETFYTKAVIRKNKVVLESASPISRVKFIGVGDRPVGGGRRGVGLSWRTSGEGCVGWGRVVKEEKLFC